MTEDCILAKTTHQKNRHIGKISSGNKWDPREFILTQKHFRMNLCWVFMRQIGKEKKTEDHSPQWFV